MTGIDSLRIVDGIVGRPRLIYRGLSESAGTVDERAIRGDTDMDNVV